MASLSAQCRQVYCLVDSWHPLRHRGALHAISSLSDANGVSSTASQAGENDETNVATQRSSQAFSTSPRLQPSEEVGEEQKHHRIHP